MKPDSTVKMDKEQQRQNYMEVLGVLAKSANILQVIKEATGKVPDYEKLLNGLATLTDMPNVDELFIEAPQPPDPATQVTPDHILQAQQQDHQQTMDYANLAMQGQPSPIAPKSVGGMLFNDPAIHAVASDLHSMRSSNAGK
jgi:hypothetical protein